MPSTTDAAVIPDAVPPKWFPVASSTESTFVSERCHTSWKPADVSNTAPSAVVGSMIPGLPQSMLKYRESSLPKTVSIFTHISANSRSESHRSISKESGVLSGLVNLQSNPRFQRTCFDHVDIGMSALVNLSIAPTIKVWRSHSQRAEHAAYLLAMFGRMVDGLNHDNSRLHKIPVLRLESSLQVVAWLISRQGQQPFSAGARGLLQLGECRANIAPCFNGQGQE